MTFFRDCLNETEEEYQRKVKTAFCDTWREELCSCKTIQELSMKEKHMLHDLDETLLQAVGLEIKYREALLYVGKYLSFVVEMKKKEMIKNGI